MTLCLMKRSHFKAWCERLKYTRNHLESLARQKGAKLRVSYWPGFDEPIWYWVFPPGVTSVPYSQTMDRFQVRKFLESLPDVD